MNSSGDVNFSAIVAQGSNRGKKVFSEFTDLIPKPSGQEQNLRPDEEEIKVGHFFMILALFSLVVW